MATQVGGLVRDQNLNVHFDVAPLEAKTNVVKAPKNGGGLGGRKALNDISNSGRPSTLQISKKKNKTNVNPIGEEIGPSKMISSFGGKRNVSKVPEKVQTTSGRKALSDLTNSGKPHLHQASKRSHDNRLGAVAEEVHNVAEEQFLHNHQECMKGKAIDIDYFLKTIGLDNDNTMQLPSPRISPLSRKLVTESPAGYSEIDEMSELLFEDQPEQKKNKMSREETSCGSPESPKHYVQWEDYNFPNFKLLRSPKLHKH